MRVKITMGKDEIFEGIYRPGRFSVYDSVEKFARMLEKRILEELYLQARDIFFDVSSSFQILVEQSETEKLYYPRDLEKVKAKISDLIHDIWKHADWTVELGESISGAN